MEDESLKAFLALRDLVIKLQLEQVEALRTMQDAIGKLAMQVADTSRRLDELERRLPPDDPDPQPHPPRPN